MNAGKLNRRARLQAQKQVQDDAGQLVDTWVDVAPVWANISDISGREFLSADAVQNAAQTKITIRYRAGVTPAMRVVHGSDTYSIEAVLGTDRVSLLLMCKRLA
jgi:SPP1 family predicted phage head-tail adaptor